jgi:hypothetical protein
MSLQKFAEVVSREEGRIGETAIPKALIDKMVRLITKNTFKIKTATTGLRTSDGS